MGPRTTTFCARACGRASRITLATFALFLLLFRSLAGAAEPPQRPAEMLARLVSPDMAVVVTVEGLREHASAFFKSRLADDLWRLPAVRAWLGSEKLKDLDRARAQIETHLGVSLTDVRDELLGDAVILAVRLPLELPADAHQARGLLLVQARDPALRDRLIRAVNKAQQESGELARVVDRHRNGTTYHVREFPAAAGRPLEWYVGYPDGTFAFSNSETMILSVIDRKAAGQVAHDPAKAYSKDDPGLEELPRFKAVRGKLPERALVRVFVDPRHVERLLATANRPVEPSGARVMAMLARYLAAVDYAGAALTWSDQSIAIHTVETLTPSRLDPWLLRWASDSRRVDPTASDRVPPSALAVASGHVHALALLDAVTRIVPEEDQVRLTNLETLLSGLSLGQDLRTRILPLVGPGILAYFDAPAEADGPANLTEPKPTPAATWPFPIVVVISLGGTSEPVVSLAAIPLITTALAAIDNALRTVLAMVAMDDKRAQGRSRITTRVVAGTTMTTLDPPIAFAYAVDHVRHRLVLSTSPTAVARYLEHAASASAGSSFGRIRAATFADAVTYACVDFDALERLVARHHDRLVQSLAARQKRSADEVDRDLSQALALAKLFRAGFITSRFEKDATAVYRSVGLFRHELGGK
jgi:hypothetical protein